MSWNWMVVRMGLERALYGANDLGLVLSSDSLMILSMDNDSPQMMVRGFFLVKKKTYSTPHQTTHPFVCFGLVTFPYVAILYVNKYETLKFPPDCRLC